MSVRTCVGCRQPKAVADLIRCRLDADRCVRAGASARQVHGRGAWICAGSTTCFDVAVSRGGFARAWRERVEPAAFAGVRDIIEDPSRGCENRGWSESPTAAVTKG